MSTVSALHTRSTEHIDNRNVGDARAVLNDIADTCGRIGPMTRRFRRVGVVIGPEHAQLLARQGCSKQDVREYLAEHSGRTAGTLRAAGRSEATDVFTNQPGAFGAQPSSKGMDDLPDDENVTAADRLIPKMQSARRRQFLDLNFGERRQVGLLGVTIDLKAFQPGSL